MNIIFLLLSLQKSVKLSLNAGAFFFVLLFTLLFQRNTRQFQDFYKRFPADAYSYRTATTVKLNSFIVVFFLATVTLLLIHCFNQTYLVANHRSSHFPEQSLSSCGFCVRKNEASFYTTESICTLYKSC